MDAGAPISFQHVARAKVFKEAPDEDLVRRHLEETLPMVFNQLEALFVERHGAEPVQLTFGNLSMWSLFGNLSHAGVEFKADRWPRLARSIEAIGKHSVLAEIVE